MSTVFNKLTGVILYSVHTPDYKEPWVINPRGLDAAKIIPMHYRVSDKDAIREATILEKEDIDEIRLPLIKEQMLVSCCNTLRDKLIAILDKEDIESNLDKMSLEFIKSIDEIKALDEIKEV